MLSLQDMLWLDSGNTKAHLIKIKYTDNSIDDKITNLESFLEANKSSYDGLKYMVELFISSNQKEKAVSILEELVEIYPRDTDSWKLLIETLVDLGRDYDAEEHYNNAHRFIPQEIKKIKSPRDNGKQSKDEDKQTDLSELLSTPGIGLAKAKVLYEAGYTTQNSLIEATFEELCQIPGIGENAAKKIMDGLKK